MLTALAKSPTGLTKEEYARKFKNATDANFRSDNDYDGFGTYFRLLASDGLIKMKSDGKHNRYFMPSNHSVEEILAETLNLHGEKDRPANGESSVVSQKKPEAKHTSPIDTAPDELATAADELEKARYFDPSSDEDARKRVLREIVQRQGQPRFRTRLIGAYGGRCAVTKCSVLHVLEAAHISPYRGEQTNPVTNGILLRSDIHTLFDLNLLGINPDDDFKVTFAASVLGGTYEKLNGTNLRLPKDDRQKPSPELLRIRWREFLDQ